MKIWRAQSAELSIEVRKQSSLEQRVFAEINAWNDMTGTESNLLGFGEEIVRIPIQHHPANHLYGHHFFWNELRCVKNIERKCVGGSLIDDLKAQFPLDGVPCFDGFKQIPAVKIRVGTANLRRFVPEDRGCPKQGSPMEFDEVCFVSRVDQTERIHTESFHHSQRSGNGTIR